MKKFLALLFVAALCLFPTAPAQSESAPFDFALPDSDDAGSMTLTLDGRELLLSFDSDPTYSLVENGFVQSSFYAYASDGTLYELYLFFPETVQSGDRVSTQSALDSGDEFSGVILSVSTYSSALYAAASQEQGAAYPSGSSYVLSFEEVSQSDSQTVYAGALEATLMVLDAQDNPVTDCTASGSFRFAMTRRAAESTVSPELPQATLPPSFSIPASPALTPPPEARRI